MKAQASPCTESVRSDTMAYGALLFTWLAGLAVLPLRPGLTAGRLPMAFGAGVFAISLQMLAYDLAGLPWNRWALPAPWLFLFGLRLYRNGARALLPDIPTFPANRAVLWLLVALPIAAWLPYERLMPLTSVTWDAWAIWLFKAKAFYLDSGVTGFLSRADEFSHHQPGYPLLFPLYGSFLYVLQGGVNEWAAKAVTPCFHLATIGLVYSFGKRFGRPTAALAFAAMAAASTALGRAGFEYAGYADIVLGFYLLASAGFLYAWWRSSENVDLAAASLAGVAAAWTKNEGQLFLLAVLLLAAARLLGKRGSVKSWFLLLGPPAAVMGVWTALRASFEIEAAGFSPLTDFSPELFSIALSTLLIRAFQWNEFQLAAPLLLAAAVGGIMLRPRPAFWIPVFLVAWQIGGVLLVYATGANDLTWWLGTSADRVLSQLVPLALLSAMLLYAEWSERLEQSPPAY